MSAKRRKSGRSSPERDEAPEITDSWVAGADLYHGKKLVRRGRPKLASPRKLLSLRLPPEVIDKWKATGPGWQTRMAGVLERSTPKSGRSAG
ncbi:MAG: BrnA antitoxin family protein [Chromatiales bacterium]|nr:BrnA antitoxin family protein [Chromatiales bacterium]HRY16087.1 BrnA antitoxin family protein [Candidatus Competibacteraceae bacterium]